MPVSHASNPPGARYGRAAPMKREQPRKEDYDALSTELGKRGWTTADLQLFTDARALSRAAPEKVCTIRTNKGGESVETVIPCAD